MSAIRRFVQFLAGLAAGILRLLGLVGDRPESTRPPAVPPGQKARVAVLGGGCGSMATAFELTATPELRERFDVTVYQQGWRLGGKGASGRNVTPGYGLRIQEHGLHMWMGFYENAFSTIQACYEEWDKSPDNPFQTWKDAFTAQNLINLMEKREVDGLTTWEPWTLDFTGIECGVPGKPLTAIELLKCMVRLLLHHHERHPVTAHGTRGHDALSRIKEHLESAGADPDPAALSAAVAGHIAAGHEHVQDSTASTEGLDLNLRRVWLMLNLGWAMFKGFVEDVLPHGAAGYAKIDDVDFRAWLVSHGARPEYTEAAPIRALYDLGFAYEDGDIERPSAAAGVVLRVVIGMVFGSRGAPLWRMNAGMGDTIFTPLYEVLEQRGVKFEFFRRVTDIGLDKDPETGENRVATIEVARQVDVLPGYRTLIPVRHLPCWPSEPDWEHIEDGAAIKARLDAQGLTLESHWCQQEVGHETLEVGHDFDIVVCGISVAALSDITGDLITASDDWKNMVYGVRTVATQALQLWVNEGLDGLGWDHGAVVSTAFAEPTASWAVMSHLIPMEDWPEGDEPKGIHYFCGPLDLGTAVPPPGAHTFPREMLDRVFDGSASWLSDNIAVLWPRAAMGNGFNLNWSALYDPRNEVTEDRFAFQYFRANIDPTERYVLSVPKTTRLRLHPGDSGFPNLFLAGDWTRTRLNAGSVEAAIESGMLAARAISGYPKKIHGVGELL
ncbi:MAG: FAD-dependent oxidoreductase [Gemmatimonadota bacterium]